MGLVRFVGKSFAKGASKIYEVATEESRKQEQEQQNQARQRQEQQARQAQAEADERAYWNSPEGRQVRAERELADIRRRERENAASIARSVADEEHRRQQESLRILKDL